MAISAYLKDRLLNLTLRNTTFPAITTVWCSLHVGDPGQTGTGSPLASCPRFPVTFNAAVSATCVQAATASVISSASAAAISWLGLWDGSATATANHLWNGQCASNTRILAAGATCTLASGIIKVNLAG